MGFGRRYDAELHGSRIFAQAAKFGADGSDSGLVFLITEGPCVVAAQAHLILLVCPPPVVQS